jgi:hypothetical protein
MANRSRIIQEQDTLVHHLAELASIKSPTI